MASDETEWSLQKRLTRSWLRDEVVVLDEEPLFLAAWELMTDFRINDSRRHWSLPSIDFVFLDRVGAMVLVELKRKVMTRRDGWNVICQVTHRAHELAAGFSTKRLETAHIDCYSGTDGRVRGAVAPTNLLDAHAHGFDQPALQELPGAPVRRLVMAKEFGSVFAHVLHRANSESRERVVATLDQFKARGEIRRYLDLAVDPAFIDPEPARAVTTDGSRWPPAG